MGAFLILSASVGVAGFLASSASNLGSLRQGEHPRTHHHVVPEAPRSLVCLFSPAFRLLLLGLDIMSMDFSCT